MGFDVSAQRNGEKLHLSPGTQLLPTFRKPVEEGKVFFYLSLYDYLLIQNYFLPPKALLYELFVKDASEKSLGSEFRPYFSDFLIMIYSICAVVSWSMCQSRAASNLCVAQSYLKRNVAPICWVEEAREKGWKPKVTLNSSVSVFLQHIT